MDNSSTMVSVGSILISVGPTAVVLMFFVLPRPQLLIVSVLSAFWWCIAMFLAAAVWWMIPPARQVFGWVLFETVAIQEGMRWLLYYIFHQLVSVADDLRAFVRVGPKANAVQAVAIGASWGLMSVLVNHVSFLKDSYMDDSAIYVEVCSINFWVATASFALAFSIMHIGLAIVAWRAYAMPNSIRKFAFIAVALLIHLAFSLIGLGNLGGNCGVILGVTWAMLFVFAAAVFWITFRDLAHAVET